MRLPAILNATATALVACDGGDTALPGPGTSNRSLGGLASDVRRIVIFMFGQTQPGQDLFIRGGLDHDRAGQLLGRDCTAANYACAMPISHLNLRNATTEPWKRNEAFLDWYGAEAQQTGASHGLVAQEPRPTGPPWSETRAGDRPGRSPSTGSA